jgi:hypothetical protein
VRIYVRLVTDQAPEAADGSSGDLCTGALARVVDARRELIEHPRWTPANGG